MAKNTKESVPVHITFLLDRSGSMQSVRDDVVGGFNGFLAEQKGQPGECRLTVIQFDTQGYDYKHMAEPIEDVKEMQPEDFVPRGGTPLYDSIARAIGDADTRLASKKVDENQLFVIFTDGEENQSSTYAGEPGRRQIFEMIELRQGKGWTFVYLGANQDAYKAGGGIGIARGSTQTYAGTGAGTQAAFQSLSANTRGMRTSSFAGQSVSPDFFTYAGKEAEEELKKEAKAKHPNTQPPTK